MNKSSVKTFPKNVVVRKEFSSVYMYFCCDCLRWLRHLLLAIFYSFQKIEENTLYQDTCIKSDRQHSSSFVVIQCDIYIW